METAALPVEPEEPAPRSEGAPHTARRLAVPPGVLLFALTTFASAFLIFLVQPIVAKRIVPWFGGVPAVWSVCLAFYQTTLFAGYAYAYLLIGRAGPRTQLVVHAAAIAAAAIALPVLPSDAWKPEGTGDPTAEIIAMLLANVALPFFALAATGPLVAVWFARRYPGRSPYPLYAVSNLGSLVALLAYPFALEPRLPLSATGQLWSGAFLATAASVIACAALASRTHAAAAPEPAPVTDAGGADATPGRIALWVLLSACAVVLLMGVTNHLCLDVASIPFLWILPLAIYLLTLIVCFGAPRIYLRIPFALLAVVASFPLQIARLFRLAAAFVDALGGMLTFEIARNGVFLFAVCMVLHGELYRLRPPARSLTTYYLCTSGGGALGGLAVGLVAPRVFIGFYELDIGIALACVLALFAWRLDATGFFRATAPGWRFAIAVALGVVALGIQGSQFLDRPAGVIHQERSFFGVLRVEDKTPRPPTPPHRALLHGTTMHGAQIVGQEDKPTTYYGLHTGIELALGMRTPDVPVEVGVIGLGTGTLSAYGRPGDHFRFFEIDPAVIRLTRDGGYFTFLSRSKATVDIIQGDGRISVARERERNAPLFDYLIVDAYSSDAVPIHLLTREAIALYVASLSPDGFLAIHTSSRNFDMMPTLFRVADEMKLPVVNLGNSEAPVHLSNASTWVFFCRNEERLRELARAAQQRYRARGVRMTRPPVIWPSPEMIARAPLWTDDYSDLFRVLK
jgi:spermidine synthase